MNERNHDKMLDDDLAALKAATADVRLRPGLAARAIAAARAEDDLFSRLLRAARFELPALATVAAAAVILAVRVDTSAAPASTTTVSSVSESIAFFPDDESADAWAGWAYDSGWDDELWSGQDG